MPGELATNLAGILNDTEIASVFGVITTAASYRGVNEAAYEGIVSSSLKCSSTLLADLPLPRRSPATTRS